MGIKNIGPVFVGDVFVCLLYRATGLINHHSLTPEELCDGNAVVFVFGKSKISQLFENTEQVHGKRHSNIAMNLLTSANTGLLKRTHKEL